MSGTMSKSRGRSIKKQQSGVRQCPPCSDDEIYIALPPHIFAVDRYKFITVFASTAHFKGLEAQVDGDILKIRGSNAFKTLRDTLGIKVESASDLCNDLCKNIYWSAAGDKVDVSLGLGYSKEWFAEFREEYLYQYGKSPWLFIARNEAGGKVRPLAGHVNVGAFSGLYSFVRSRVRPIPIPQLRVKYELLLAELTGVWRYVVEELYSLEKAEIKLKERQNIQRKKKRTKTTAEIILKERPPLSNPPSVEWLVDVWVKLSLLESLPGGEGRVPTLAVVKRYERAVSLSYINPWTLDDVSTAFKTAAEEMGFEVDSAVRYLKWLLKKADGLGPGPMGRALMFVDSCLAGRVDWDLYYQIRRELVA